ncbi:hypothetical protein B296_00034284 [Ensete ventricosum]|uniref:Uncharacterized protein n=1 Tax=Ensete ventricosum TaxID=4639 RepID=A0A426XIY3_ENSVE|nr:hypothetical protein B296_00034284 [Ensete ventricosum]
MTLWLRTRSITHVSSMLDASRSCGVPNIMTVIVGQEACATETCVWDRGHLFPRSGGQRMVGTASFWAGRSGSLQLWVVKRWIELGKLTTAPRPKGRPL